MLFDVLIVGAGPVGLSLAALLADRGMDVAVFDRQKPKALADPAYDGREIALSEKSIQILRDLGAWDQIDAAETFPIKQALVQDGGAPFCLHFDPKTAGADQLGVLVSNHLIRKAMYDVIKDKAGITLFAGAEVTKLDRGAKAACITLKSGEQYKAPLAVAADTRFSQIRRDAGISADMHDFGHTMIVGRMHHERSHDHIARELFLYDGGLAVLPLGDNVSSIVQTFAAEQARVHMDMPDMDYAGAAQARLQGVLGKMTCADKRVSYPLVGVYAHRFYASRLALVGDAAVGMHPVTAHGFNFGVQGALLLAGQLAKAYDRSMDLGAPAPLLAYDRAHRRLSWPLYQLTLRMMQLYTNTNMPARLVRTGMLRMVQMFGGPAKTLLLGKLANRSLPNIITAQFH